MTMPDAPLRPMTPSDYLAIVKRRKWSLILPAAVLFLIAALTALLLPAVYRSSSTILIEEKQIPDEFVLDTVTTYVEQRLQSINQRIMSYTRLKEVIDRYELYPELKGRLTDDEIVEKMKDDIHLEPISAETPDRRTGRESEATIAFTLAYEGKNPSKVQQIANVLASMFLEENIRVRSQQTTETAEFIEEEANRVKELLREKEIRIAEFKQKHFNELPDLLQANLQGLANVERDISRLKEQMRSFQERKGYLQTQLSSMPAARKTEREQNLATLEQLKLRLIDLQTQYSEKYPDVIKTKAEIGELEKKITADEETQSQSQEMPDNPAYITLAAQLTSTETEISSIRRQLKDLESKKKEYDQRIANTPPVEKEIKSLLMEEKSTRAKFDDLTKKLMDARIAQGLEKEQKGEHFTLIDPARFPEKPVKPNRLAILLIGFVLSIGAGVGVASLREYSDRSVRDVDGLMFLGLLPVLGSIPEIVTTEESRKKRLKRLGFVLVPLLTLTAGVLAFHYFVMDLDIFWIKLMRKFIQLGIF